MTVSIVVAATDGEVIGSGGVLPWHLPEDLRHFKRLTLGHVAVMGRVTYQSILDRLGRALPGRMSVVVSSKPLAGDGGGVLSAATPRAALDIATGMAQPGRQVFVIGGESIYRQLLPAADRVYLTRIHQDFDGDRRMPDGWLDGFELTAARPGTDPAVPYEFLEYRRARP